jgi:hypothetical protein
MLTYYSQLAQLSVHEPEPEPEPEPGVAPPVAAAGLQGLIAVAQYDYEVRVYPYMDLIVDRIARSLNII